MESPQMSSTFGIVGSRSRSRLDFEIFPHLPQCKLSSANISALEQDGKLCLRMFVHLILMYKTYEYRHEWMIL